MTILDRAYFHVHNGGLTMSIENTSVERPCYELVVSVRNFGVELAARVPLPNHHVVGWLHHATGKLLERMKAEYKPRPFGDCPARGERPDGAFVWDFEKGLTEVPRQENEMKAIDDILAD